MAPQCSRWRRATPPSSLSRPQLPRAQVWAQVDKFVLPFDAVSVFHKVKFELQDAQGFTGTSTILDSVHVTPQKENKQGKIVAGRFDTVLFSEKSLVGNAELKGKTIP